MSTSNSDNTSQTPTQPLSLPSEWQILDDERDEKKSTPPNDEAQVNLLVVLDMSGSMRGLTEKTRSDFKEFIQEQLTRNPHGSLTVKAFNTEVTTLYRNVPLTQVPLDHPLPDYQPNGMTALHDALYELLTESDRTVPSVVLVVTDGFDTASHRSNPEQVRNEIQSLRTNQGWEFFFAGVNLSEETTREMGNQYGIAQTSASGQGLLGVATRAVSEYRGRRLFTSQDS